MSIVQLLGLGDNIRQTPEIPGAERWCLNNPFWYRRKFKPAGSTWTRWFNLHGSDHMRRRYPEAYLGWFQCQDGSRPIYLREEDDTIPGGITFPRETLQQFFARNGDLERYFTSSVAWMMAFAAYEAVTQGQIERIELRGIVCKGEHVEQAPCVAWWVERIRGMDIDVLVPPEVNFGPVPSGKYTGPLYGYETIWTP
jgi:hypothetical protein